MSTKCCLAPVVLAAAFFISMPAVPAAAQVPTVAVFFDGALTSPTSDCQGLGVIDTLYAATFGFNDWLSALEFSVDYSTVTAFTWIADAADTPLVIGSTPFGIALTWQLPQSGFSPLAVVRIIVVWNCDACAGNEGQVLAVKPHPQTGHIRAVRYPDRTFIDAIGDIAVVCPVFPVETRTWGAVKALYAD